MNDRRSRRRSGNSLFVLGPKLFESGQENLQLDLGFAFESQLYYCGGGQEDEGCCQSCKSGGVDEQRHDPTKLPYHPLASGIIRNYPMEAMVPICMIRN